MSIQREEKRKRGSWKQAHSKAFWWESPVASGTELEAKRLRDQPYLGSGS